MKKLIVCLIVLAFALVGSAGAQNLLTDGGFELDLLTGPDEWQDFYTGEFMGAWEVTSTSVCMLFGCGPGPGGGSWTPPPLEGNEIASLGSGYGPGVIEQSFATTIGDSYEVSFYAREYGSAAAAPDGTAGIRVYNGSGDDLLDTFFHDQTWTQYFFEFTATDTTSTLEFTNGTTTVDSVTIDDVWVVLGCTTVGTTEPVDPCGLVVYENAAHGSTTGAFTVVLDSSPGATDTITVDIDPNSNGNGPDVTVNLTQLTFTAANWDTAQTVTVTAIDDTWADGYSEVDQVGFTVTSAESDPCYADGCLGSVTVTIFDDDSADIFVSKTDVSVAEAGPTSDTYTVELLTPPASPVTIIVAADYTEISETDSNMVAVPFDCQLTINGAGSATLVFNSGNYDTPQTVTVAAVDDSMVEVDPHVITIGNHVDTDDPEYSAISVPNVDVSITDNDARAWSFGDDVLLSLPPNSSFETPALSEGESYVNPDPDINPFGTTTYFNGVLPIRHISDPCWALMYEVGQTVPDGDNVLEMPGNTEVGNQYLGYASGSCEHLIEPGPVSYTLTMAVGLPKEAGGSANPDAYASLTLHVAPPAGWDIIADSGNLIAELNPGEWEDKTVCVEIPADSPYIGSPLYFDVNGEHVHFDNLRLTVGNHPCDGCYVDITAEEGDLNGDCIIDLADFSIMAGNYLDCNIYPDCVTIW